MGLLSAELGLQGADLTRQAIMKRIAGSLTRVRTSQPAASDGLHRRFTECRGKRNEHVARLHQPRLPFGLSVFALQGLLLRLPAAARNGLRWPQPYLARLTADTARQVGDLLKAAAFPGLFTQRDPSPWAGARLTDAETAWRAVDLVERIRALANPVQIRLAAVLQASGLPESASLKPAAERTALAAAGVTTLAGYPPGAAGHAVSSGRGGGAEGAPTQPLRTWKCATATPGGLLTALVGRPDGQCTVYPSVSEPVTARPSPAQQRESPGHTGGEWLQAAQFAGCA